MSETSVTLTQAGARDLLAILDQQECSEGGQRIRENLRSHLARARAGQDLIITCKGPGAAKLFTRLAAAAAGKKQNQ